MEMWNKAREEVRLTDTINNVIKENNGEIYLKA